MKMFDDVLVRFKDAQVERVRAYVLGYDGSSVEIGALSVQLGTQCLVKLKTGLEFRGEVIKVGTTKNIVAMYDTNIPIAVGDEVQILSDGNSVRVGNGLLGRVVDALGDFIDNKPSTSLHSEWPLYGKKINSASRQKIDSVLDVGVRVINSALTLGKGQRVGIFAGSGVGKSTLISMITEFTEADIIVVGLIGERGREVADFIRKNKLSANLKKTVIVAEPADSSPLLRLKGVQRATAISEYFRSQGKDVLLIVDSLTRVAHAQREIGLSRGEAAIDKGYTPSVLNLIPKLIERAGCSDGETGSITAIYTVLADGDDFISDPIIDTSRAILDGHIVLSRQNAQQGIFPAIDLPMSVSRVMNDIVPTEHIQLAERLRALISCYLENRDLILLGGYNPGQNEELDTAIKIWPEIVAFLKQKYSEPSLKHESLLKLSELLK